MFANALDILLLAIGAGLAFIGYVVANGARGVGGGVFGVAVIIVGIVIAIDALRSLVG